MSSDDSSLMVRGPSAAKPLPPGLSASRPESPAPRCSPVTSPTAPAVPFTRLSPSPAGRLMKSLAPSASLFVASASFSLCVLCAL